MLWTECFPQVNTSWMNRKIFIQSLWQSMIFFCGVFLVQFSFDEFDESIINFVFRLRAIKRIRGTDLLPVQFDQAEAWHIVRCTICTCYITCKTKSKWTSMEHNGNTDTNPFSALIRYYFHNPSNYLPIRHDASHSIFHHFSRPHWSLARLIQ